MKKTLKGSLSLILASVLVFGAAPLQGFTGFNLHMPQWLAFGGFTLKADAAVYSGKCGENVSWSLDTGTGVLDITGTGNMDNYENSGPSFTPWYEYRSSIATLNVGGGVTSTGKRAFSGCGNLTSISLPESITLICQESFFQCTGLTSLTIPAGVTVIGSWPFAGCTSLQRVNFNAVNCGDLNEGILDGCTALTAVTIGSGVTAIPDFMFSGCTGITAVTVPGSVTRIGECAFAGCGALASITIPASVTNIGEDAFVNCGSVKILCYENSYAHAYADRKMISFEFLSIPVAGISLNQAEANLCIGDTLQLTAAVVPPNAANTDVAWSSGDKSVATVSDAGLVTAVAIGTAELNCTAKDGSGASAVCTVTVLPVIPGNVRASSYGYNSVQIAWGAVPGATGYIVYRFNPSTQKYDKIKVTADLNFTDTGLITGKTVSYKVRAYTKAGTLYFYGDPSASVNSVPVPAIPGSAKAASASYNSIKISWSAVAGATGYAVYKYNPSTKLFGKLKSVTAAVYTDTGLATGKEYSYYVKAYRTESGTNVYGSATAAVKAKPVPGTPGSFKAVRASSSSAKISWSAVSGVSGYVIYRYNPATDAFERIKVTTLLSFTETKLVTWRVYYYKVSAYRTVNGVNIYGKATDYCGVAVTPDAPGSPKVVSSSMTSIKISWPKVSGASGYLIYVYDFETMRYKRYDYTTSNSYVDNFMTFNQGHRYKVCAYKIISDDFIICTALSPSVDAHTSI